jgi:hypothetical protein
MLFDHMARDMAHAHDREMQLNARSTRAHVRETRGGPCERGTTFLRRMRGDRFSFPSLCDIYGSRVGTADGASHSAARSSPDSL